MVSKKDFNAAEFGDHEDIEKSYDGVDGQRRGANKRRSNGKRQRIGFIRDGYASWRNSRSSFSREALRGSSWVYLPVGQRSKTTSHQRGQDNRLQYISNYVPFVVLGFSSSSSTPPTPTSSSSSSQNSVSDESRYNDNPVSERIGSTSEEPRGNPAPQGSGHFQFFSWITDGGASKQRNRVSIVSTRTFRRTQIATPAWRQK